MLNLYLQTQKTQFGSNGLSYLPTNKYFLALKSVVFFFLKKIYWKFVPPQIRGNSRGTPGAERGGEYSFYCRIKEQDANG